ncbi:MAG: hypothetical protein ABI741_04305 [Ferruginibacter sp.]
MLINYRNFLEETIREHPDNYLWSHRRWKWEYKKEYERLWVDEVPAPEQLLLQSEKDLSFINT